MAGAGFDGQVNAVVVQADGKLIVGGNFSSYNGDANAPNDVLRLNADGSRDLSFNPGGTGLDGGVNALALQPDGKVVVGGGFGSYNGNAATPNNVMRLNADGTYDGGFNTNAVGTDGVVYAVAVQADGKVLVGGRFFQYNGNSAAPDHVLRLTTFGTLDLGFNAGGAGPNNEVYVLLVQPDQQILVGGRFVDYNGNGAITRRIIRLNTNGSVDFTFGNTARGADNDVLALALQPNGQILIGGMFTTWHGAPAPDGVIRVNTDGNRDIFFNNGGSGLNSYPSALAVQPDGKILVGGGFTAYNGSGAAPDNLLRLLPNGSLDNGFFGPFNAGGTGPDSYVQAVAVQADGKIVAGGNFTAYNGNAAAPDRLLRLNADGSLNDTAVPATGLTYNWSNGATGATITVSQPGDYQALVTNTAGTGRSNVVRVNAPPVVTTTVTPVGPLNLPTGGSALLSATATVPGYNVAGVGFNGTVYVAVPQADGKVLVGGFFTLYNGLGTASDRVLRLNADGSLDTGFNAGGVGVSGGSNLVLALAVQPDGKILVGGNFLRYNGSTTVPRHVLRLNANGSLDTSFNPGGTGTSNEVYGLAVQPDGKILVAGNFTTYNGNAAAPDMVLRLLPDGTLDPSFNAGGTGAGGDFRAMVLQPDGKVLLGGNPSVYNGTAFGRGVLRLNADGYVDPTFNPGRARTAPGSRASSSSK